MPDEVFYGGYLSDCTPVYQYLWCNICKLALVDDSGSTSLKSCPGGCNDKVGVCSIAMEVLTESHRLRLGLKPFKEWHTGSEVKFTWSKNDKKA